MSTRMETMDGETALAVFLSLIMRSTRELGITIQNGAVSLLSSLF